MNNFNHPQRHDTRILAEVQKYLADEAELVLMLQQQLMLVEDTLAKFRMLGADRHSLVDRAIGELKTGMRAVDKLDYDYLSWMVFNDTLLGNLAAGEVGDHFKKKLEREGVEFDY